jgi:hypothetical protein
LTYYATDTGAASSAVATVTVKLDTVNPTLTWGVATPAPNGFGWNKTAVTFPWTASDATSGVATPGATGSLIVSTQGTSQTGTVTVTDVAGNSQTFTSPAVNIDLTTPVVSAVANPATAKIGKGTINVTVSGTVTDALSGVNRPSGTYRISPGTTTGTFTIGATGAYSFKISIPGKTATTYTITVGASDLAGNLGTATTTVTIR